MLELEAAPPVEHPERPARRGDGGHGAVEELDVELGGLDVGFREVGDLGDQLADLILCLLEQTWVDGFFRHWWFRVGSQRPNRQASRRVGRAPTDNPGARRVRHNVNGTTKVSNFPELFSRRP